MPNAAARTRDGKPLDVDWFVTRFRATIDADARDRLGHQGPLTDADRVRYTREDPIIRAQAEHWGVVGL